MTHTLQYLKQEAVKDSGYQYIYKNLSEDDKRIMDIFLNAWLEKAYAAGQQNPKRSIDYGHDKLLKEIYERD